MGRVVFVLCSRSMATVQWPQSQRICIVSLQHFGGRSGITSWGQGAQHPTMGPCCRSHLTPALTTDHECFWSLGQKLIAYDGQLGQRPPVLISASLVALGAPVRSHCAHCWQVRPGQASAAAFVHPPCAGWCWASFDPEAAQQPSQGQGWPGKSMAEGYWDGPTCCRQLPAICFVPGCPHCASSVPNPHPCAGAEPGLFWGASAASPLWNHPQQELLGKVLEHQGEQSLLSPPYRDGPAGPC